MSEKKAPSGTRPDGRWPFDPMQPGDHEPVRLPEAMKHMEKQNPAPKPNKEKK